MRSLMVRKCIPRLRYTGHSLSNGRKVFFVIFEEKKNSFIGPLFVERNNIFSLIKNGGCECTYWKIYTK